MSLISSCIICGEDTPSPKKITRWGSSRKYCSSKCCKTAYRLKYPDRDKESKQQWVLENPTKRKASSVAYMQRNRAYYNAYSSLRQRYATQAKPKCLSEFDELFIQEFYDAAHRRGLEVDHIIPLKHQLVCGLHVPENLQMLTRAENARKSNSFTLERG